MVFQVKKLNSRIVNKKSALAPILKSLRSLRQQCQVRINPIKTQNPSLFRLVVEVEKMPTKPEPIIAVVFSHIIQNVKQ